jgi:predicted dehydrogenase
MLKGEKSIGVVLVGAGYWGINYVRVFNELPHAHVAVVCDARESRLAEISKRFPKVRTSTSLSEALAMDGVDAAVVCTGATTHYALVKQCLEAGKHVMVEKPMTTSTPDGSELRALAAAKGLTLMVGHTFLYNEGVRRVKQLLNNQGKVYYLYARRTNLGPIRTDVNALWDLAPHDVSIFNHWLNSRPMWVSAVGLRALKNNQEDVGFVTLGYPDNIVAHIHVSWADPNKVRELVVVSSNRRIVFDDLNSLEPVRVFEKGVSVGEEINSFGEHQLSMRDGDIISPRVEVREPLRTECAHYIDCVLNGTAPLTDATTGLDVVSVMEAIDQSIDRNGAPVTVDYAPEAIRVVLEQRMAA